MKYKKIYTVIFLTFLFTKFETVFAQTNTSPYSIFGIGDIVNKNFDRSSGMGNAGISLASNRYMYDENPASLPYLTDHFLTVEVSANLNNINYRGEPLFGSSVTSSQAQVQRFAIGLKVMPFWGLSFGLKQFSSSNYLFSEPQYIIGAGSQTIGGGASQFVATHTGSGGINQVFISNGFRIGKNFSLGINSSYLFGHMQDEKDIIVYSQQFNSTLNQYYAHLFFEAGAQYHAQLSSKWKLGLGAIVSNKADLNGHTYYTLTQGDGTVALPNQLVNDSIKGSSYFNLPVMYGGGLSLTYDDKLTFAIDYKQQNWNSVNNLTGLDNPGQEGSSIPGGQNTNPNAPPMNTNSVYSFKNANQISGGLEYTKRKSEYYRNQLILFDKYFYQFGGYYNKEYLDINGEQIKDYGLTLGIGINSFKTGLGTMFNFQIGSRGTTKQNLIKENYFQVGVTLTYQDFWRRYKLQ